MGNTFQFRSGIKSNLPTLNQAEVAYTTDDGGVWIGDGAANHYFGPIEVQQSGAFALSDLATLNFGNGFTVSDSGNGIAYINYIPSDAITAGTMVSWSGDTLNLDTSVTKEPTGFTSPENITINGDPTARTVTLTGTVDAYYQGDSVTALTTGWESSAHGTDTSKAYFLWYDGSSFTWNDTSTLTSTFFQNLLIALVFYDPDNSKWVYAREVHGMQPWESHRTDHYTLGTYKYSGGGLADYTLESTTAADRRPSVAESLVYDEDLPTTVPALSAGGNYTNFTLSGASGDHGFDTSATDIVPLSGSRPYWNEFSGGTWGQTLISNNHYMNVFLLQLPMAADSDSQKIRHLWVQGQAEHDDDDEALQETTDSLNLGTLADLAPEFVFIAQITIKYSGGDWEIEEVTDISGTKVSQSTSPQGNYLTSVAVTAPLTGTGLTGDPLVITTGIADDNIVQIDDADAVADDYCKLTASGVVGRSYSEVKTDLSLGNVENTAISTWAGSANITTVGTIGTGTWQGDAITDTYISSAATWNAKIDSTDVTYENLNTNGDVGTGAAQVAQGDHNHDYSDISGADAATDATAAELEELTDGSETTLHSHVGSSGMTRWRIWAGV